MRVVIDTNVLISAILRDRIPEEVILFVAGRDDMEWIVSSEIIEARSSHHPALPRQLATPRFSALLRTTAFTQLNPLSLILTPVRTVIASGLAKTESRLA